MLKVGMLTSGGDCQALNAAMRGVAKSLYRAVDDVEIIGFEEGYRGLIYGDFRVMKKSDFSGILTEGGTIIGSSRQPFKLMRVPDENGIDKVEAMKKNYKSLGLDCLVVLGGNGTHKTANLLREEGLNVVTLPKTIDNDLWGTDMTFGFQSAVNIATNAIDCIHTTASSHGRVFIGSAGLHFMPALQVEQILFLSLRFHMISSQWWLHSTEEPRQARISRYWQLPRALYPRRMRHFLRRNLSRSLRTIHTRPCHIR